MGYECISLTENCNTKLTMKYNTDVTSLLKYNVNDFQRCLGGGVGNFDLNCQPPISEVVFVAMVSSL